MASFNSLPDEILVNIFEVGHATLYPVTTSRTGPAFEILVSQMTQRWWNVAVYTHRIWTRIEISPRTSGQLVVIYLQRSGAVALDLLINYAPGYVDSEAYSYRAYQLYLNSGWQTVIPHLSRCCSIVASHSLENMNEMRNAFRSVAVLLLERFQMIPSINNGIPSLHQVFDGGAPPYVMCGSVTCTTVYRP
jgi:hypothetical protein